MHRIFRHCIFAAALTLVSAPVFAGMVVIVSAKSAVKTMEKADVSALYLGKTSSFPGGGSAKLYDLTEANPGRDKFYTGATGKSGSQVKSLWSRLVFSGRVLPPHELPNDAAVVKAVAADPAAIGYVDSSAVDNSVKPVFKLP